MTNLVVVLEELVSKVEANSAQGEANTAQIEVRIVLSQFISELCR